MYYKRKEPDNMKEMEKREKEKEGATTYVTD